MARVVEDDAVVGVGVVVVVDDRSLIVVDVDGNSNNSKISVTFLLLALAPATPSVSALLCCCFCTVVGVVMQPDLRWIVELVIVLAAAAATNGFVCRMSTVCRYPTPYFVPESVVDSPNPVELRMFVTQCENTPNYVHIPRVITRTNV